MIETCNACNEIFFSLNNFYNKCNKCVKKFYIDIEYNDDYDF